MDKTKKSPIPDKPKEERQRKSGEWQQADPAPDPQFVRGTIDPPTKKEK